MPEQHKLTPEVQPAEQRDGRGGDGEPENRPEDERGEGRAEQQGLLEEDCFGGGQDQCRKTELYAALTEEGCEGVAARLVDVAVDHEVAPGQNEENSGRTHERRDLADEEDAEQEADDRFVRVDGTEDGET